MISQGGAGLDAVRVSGWLRGGLAFSSGAVVRFSAVLDCFERCISAFGCV